MDAYATDSKLKKHRSSNAVLNRLYELSESKNIAADIKDEKKPEGEQKLTALGQRVCEEYQIDLDSREEWEKTAGAAMKAARQVRVPKNTPWAGASNVKWPLVTVAALQFNARSYPEIVSPTGVVGAKVKGSDDGVPAIDPQTGQPAIDPQSGEVAQWEKEPGVKAAKGERVKKYMDNYILEKMDGWEEDTDVLLMQLPIVGDVVKKVYHGDDVCASDMISAFDFVVNQKTKSLTKCPRMTHRFRLYPFEIEERLADGRFVEFDYERHAATSEGDSPNDEDAPHEFLEQHRRIDLDDDGYGEPYIVTVHKSSEKICRIVANFEAEDVKADDKRILRITPSEYFVNYVFIPDPEGGFYGVGFGHILESLGAAIDTTINQMLDAGTLQNSGGGFIGSGVSLKKAVIRRELGVWKTVSATGDNLRNAIVPFEDPEPSAVLFQLLGLMLDASRDITSVKDILTGDSPQGETATTTLARIEQGMKVFTAIYKRIYRAGKAELKLIYKYLSEHVAELEGDYQTFMDEPQASMAEDFNLTDYDICPEADPRLVTDQQRLKQAEALMATIEINPGGREEILRRFYTAIGAQDVDKLLPKAQPNPMEEIAVAGAVATVKKTEAEAGKVTAEIDKVAAETEKVKAEIEKVGSESSKTEAETAKTVLEIADFVKHGPADLRKQKMGAQVDLAKTEMTGQQKAEQTAMQGRQKVGQQLVQGEQQTQQSAQQHEQARQLQREAPKPAKGK